MNKRKEYWFQRTWFGSATPTHPMGILVLFGGIAVGLAIGNSAGWFLENGHPYFGTALVGVFAVWILGLFIIISAKPIAENKARVTKGHLPGR